MVFTVKVGILTASKTNNNGTDIQAYAMQRLISSLGYDAEIIDYGCQRLNSAKNLLRVKSVKDIVRMPWNIYMQMTHEKFRKENFKRSNYMDPQNLNLSEYDAVVVGSDQVWNLTVTGNDLNFYLPPELGSFKRVSYAASIGKSNIMKWDRKYNIAALLKQFSVVSVREKSAIDCLKAIGIDAIEDLDPIIAIGKKELSTLMPKRSIQQRFVLLYLVERNPNAVADAVRYAHEHNCKTYMITNMSYPIKEVKQKWFVSLPKWLDLMNTAEVVFTNSYHGVSVAITLNRKFKAYALDSSEGNLRTISLLEKAGLLAHYAEDIGARFDAGIDWNAVNEQLEILRADSRRRLALSLGGGAICQ